uniref:Uncharacterized protein n=1 Tax=Steinernema glaseri TaxID=37863 RepID=A0A1I7YUQ6_9BILA
MTPAKNPLITKRCCQWLRRKLCNACGDEIKTKKSKFAKMLGSAACSRQAWTLLHMEKDDNAGEAVGDVREEDGLC